MKPSGTLSVVEKDPCEKCAYLAAENEHRDVFWTGAQHIKVRGAASGIAENAVTLIIGANA